jgi:hypothetical protein
VISSPSHRINELIRSMEPSPSWETNSCSVTQEIPSILWNPEVHYRGLYLEPDESSPYSLPVSIRPVFKLFFHLCIGLPSLLFLSGFCTNTLYAHLVCAYYIPCPSHPSWLDHSNFIWRRVRVMKLLTMQFYSVFLFVYQWRYLFSVLHHLIF